MRLLNVGGGHRAIALPEHFRDWESTLLDLGPDADLVWDARRLSELPPGDYDAIYCAHNLEHYYEHEVPVVLAGFRHLLKPTGLIQLIVPNLQQLIYQMVSRQAEPDALLYHSPAGPVRFCDVIYGFGPELISGGEPFAHKFGYSPRLLAQKLAGWGWQKVFAVPEAFEIHAYATLTPEPPEWISELLP